MTVVTNKQHYHIKTINSTSVVTNNATGRSRHQ